MKRVSYISCYNDSAYRSNIAGQSYGGSLRRHPKLIKKLRPQYMHICEKGYQFQQRALVLAGTNDPIVPLVNAKLMARLIRHSKLRVYDDGHPYLLTSPEEGARTLSAIRFSARGLSTAANFFPTSKTRDLCQKIKFETAPNGAQVANTFNQQFRWLAEQKGEHAAIIDEQRTISFRAFEQQTNQLARQFLAEGATKGDFILISSATPSNILLATTAAWKMGAVPMPVSERLVQRELDGLVALAKPTLVFDDTERSVQVQGKRITAIDAGAGQSADSLPDVVSPNLKAPTSGGSTGTPKIIVAGDAGHPASIVSSVRSCECPRMESA